MVPRSGCSMISEAGTAAISSISETSTQSTVRRRLPSARSATTSAMPITTASLASSEGWIDMPASWIQDRDPLIVDPLVSTSTRPPTEAR